MLKVDRKKYKEIKQLIEDGVVAKSFPSHREQKRSKKRNEIYQRIAKIYDLSMSTIHNIGRSKGYADYKRIQWPYTKATGHKQLHVRGGHGRARKVATRAIQPTVATHSDISALVEEITQLQSEMAIIKAKKRRWFR